MRYFLVTGATSGVGFDTASKLLADGDTFVFLGSLNAELGQAAAVAMLGSDLGCRADRLEVLPMDVRSDASVREAARRVAARLAGGWLCAVVSIAGVLSRSIEDSCQVNVRGIARVCQAFVPLLDPELGRVVNVTSGAGPLFVQRCSEPRKAFFTDFAVTWEALDALMSECAAVGPKAMQAMGIGSGRLDAYGFSKACANSLTLILARENPRLSVNACTPGFVTTDLSKPMIPKGKTARDIGMIYPYQVTVVMQLLTDEVQSSGWFYGSDGLRSPLDKYREPGDPPFVEDVPSKL